MKSPNLIRLDEGVSTGSHFLQRHDDKIENTNSEDEERGGQGIFSKFLKYLRINNVDKDKVKGLDFDENTLKIMLDDEKFRGKMFKTWDKHHLTIGDIRVEMYPEKYPYLNRLLEEYMNVHKRWVSKHKRERKKGKRNELFPRPSHLYKKYKLGLTTWSPLAFGTLSGKYSAGKPDSSRFTTPMFESFAKGEEFTNRVKMVDELKPIAADLGCSLAQLSIAWAVSNENVSTVLIAASRPSQLEENLKSLEFLSKMTPEVKAKIDAVVKFVPSVLELDNFPYVRNRHL